MSIRSISNNRIHDKFVDLINFSVSARCKIYKITVMKIFLVLHIFFHNSHSKWQAQELTRFELI